MKIFPKKAKSIEGGRRQYLHLPRFNVRQTLHMTYVESKKRKLRLRGSVRTHGTQSSPQRKSCKKRRSRSKISQKRSSKRQRTADDRHSELQSIVIKDTRLRNGATASDVDKSTRAVPPSS